MSSIIRRRRPLNHIIRTRSCGKVMFLHLFVCSQGEVYPSMQWGRHTGACIQACNGAGGVGLGGVHPSIQFDNQRVVYPSMHNRAWNIGGCVSQHTIGQESCEADSMHPTGMHSCSQYVSRHNLFTSCNYNHITSLSATADILCI